MSNNKISGGNPLGAGVRDATLADAALVDSMVAYRRRVAGNYRSLPIEDIDKLPPGQMLVAELVSCLLRQSFVDSEGATNPLTKDGILIVAPYNAQVRLLKEMLPEGVLVGTVDKFQGKEAEVVIVSMTTSGGEDMPRDMTFLFDRRRLNVAISRAKTLAIIVGSPRLLVINCRTPEQMALADTLCWAAECSDGAAN